MQALLEDLEVAARHVVDVAGVQVLAPRLLLGLARLRALVLRREGKRVMV